MLTSHCFSLFVCQFASSASAVSARSNYDGQEFRSATGVNYGRMRVGPSNFTSEAHHSVGCDANSKRPHSLDSLYL